MMSTTHHGLGQDTSGSSLTLVMLGLGRNTGGRSGSLRRFREAVQQDVQCHFAFRPCHRHPDADVSATAERHMQVGIPCRVEDVRIGELLRIPVRHAEERHHQGVRGDALATQFGLRRGGSRRARERL